MCVSVDRDEEDSRENESQPKSRKRYREGQGRLSSLEEEDAVKKAAMESVWEEEEEEEEKEKSVEEMCTSFPDEVLEHVLVFLTRHQDRNAVSLVCKAWFKAERWSRRKVFIGNCYALSPKHLVRRFPKITSVVMKGRPRFSDFGFVPANWGAYIYPWIQTMAEHYPWLEELRLKRMTVSDESLAMISQSFSRFRALSLTSCDGFSTDGLAHITRNCRNLAELELQENDIEFRSGAWLTGFPETYTSLVSLNFATVRSKVNYVDIVALEHLVARCPLLKTLKLNKEITPDQLQRLLQRSPNLVELGTGSYSQNLSWAQLQELQMALGKCKNLRSLSGIWEVVPLFVRTLYPVCPNLTSLNLSDVFLPTTDFARLISYCHKLQRLLVQDDVGDKGLLAASTSCKELRELRVFPVGEEGCATEQGLIAISEGCPDLRKILYFCRQMTNAAMVTFARNCLRMTHFRLCILKVYETDHVTKEPLDEGFGAICRQCKDLKRLALSGLLTDKTFEYIGQYAKNLETLSVAFAGDSYLGMQYILGGCTKLRKLEIRDCPFGDEGLLAGIHKYEAMRSLWMSTCRVTLLGCQFLAEKNRLLNVEIINERETCEQYVEKLYVYRTIAGRRNDAPPCVETL